MLKYSKKIVLLLVILQFSGCKKTKINDNLGACDSQLYSICDGKGNGQFCTFGYKWGAGNPFQNPGLEKKGPESGGASLTYAFIDGGFEFNSHSQDGLKSLTFDGFMPNCAKDEFRKAFTEYQSITNVNFSEVPSNSNPDIKIIVADISQPSFGYTNFDKTPCIEMKGLIVFKKNSYSNCDLIYGVILHEIGHVLGLGHVSTKNVMHPNDSYLYPKLQNGDLQGVQSIYGKK